MRWIAEDPERIEVLHLYTGGKPVLLSLYAALIVERPEIPHLLSLSLEEAKGHIREYGSVRVQAEIELEFVKLLFTRRDYVQRSCRRSCERDGGLDAEQLHYLLRQFARCEAWRLGTRYQPP